MLDLTWRHLALIVGLQEGRVLSDDDVHFVLWECTAYPFAPVDHVMLQLHEALTEPPNMPNRCHCCGTPKADCFGACCHDCYHPADEWVRRLGEDMSDEELAFVRRKLEATEAERDRLRAVVAKVQRLWHARGEMQATEALDQAAFAEWRAAWDEFIALDVSGDMGDGDE